MVDSQTIQNTPLNGRLSVVGLLALAPGVQGTPAQDQLAVRGVTVAIGSGTRNSYGSVGYSLDGVTNMEVSLQRGEAEVPPIDAIAEFKVITTGAAAEFNQLGQVIVVSQGGSNQLHGEALEFNRGKGTSAKSYFAGSKARPAYERNEYGGNLSGPIVIPKLYNGKDRSFFFFSYEGYHLTQSSLVSSQQPTELMRQGIFTEISTPIVDPLTGVAFTNNTIPTSRLNSVDLKLQSLLYPHPTASGTGTNTVELIPYTSKATRYSVRLDHKFSDKDQIHGTILRAFYGPNPTVGNDSLQGGNSADGEHNLNFIAGWTHTFSPTLLLDTNADFFHLPIYRTPQNVGVDFASIIPGVGQQLIEGAPQISITNITSVSESGSKDLEQLGQINTTITKVLSRHTLKAGFSYLYNNHWNNSVQSPQRGSYTFTTRYSGNAYADFLLGYPTSTANASPSDYVTRTISAQYGGFVQDDFKVTPKLTLNLGVRYDLQWFRDSPYGNGALYVPSLQKVVVFANAYPAATIAALIPNTVLAPSVGLPSSLWKYLGQDKNNFAPRFGFAYQALPNTVIRGAVGLFYNLLPSYYLDQSPFLNLPFVSSQSYTQPSGSTPVITMNAPFATTGAFGANPAVFAQHATVTPYTEQYNLAMEHQFPKGIDLRVGYVGQRNIHQNNYGGSGNTAPDINLPAPAAGAVQARRPVQPFSTINMEIDPIFHSNMDQLQVGLHKQYSHGFMINAEYSWTRVLGTENFMNPATVGDSYGNIAGLTPQVLAVSYSYLLPFGHGKMFLGNAGGIVDKIVSGWQLSGISNFQTGQFFSVSYAAPGTPVGLVSGRASVVPGVALYPTTRNKAQWFNPAAFTSPVNFTYGNSAYDMLRGPGYQDWDMSLSKNTVWKDRYHVQLRADTFNVFNHPNFAVPNSAITNTSTVGTITSTVGDSRKIEFAAKFSF